MSTIAKISKLPLCDICKHIEKRDAIPVAHYDFRMTSGTWAYGCEDHYLTHRAYRELGTGKGQKLEVAK